MNVLVVEPMKEPYLKDIASGLSSLQHEVGGYIEAIYPYEDLVGIVCNEEGKLEGLPLNRAIYNENGEMVDIISGTFLIVGLSEDNFAGLSDVMADKYAKLFESPEIFYSTNGQIHAQKVEPKAEPIQEETACHGMPESPDAPPLRQFSIYQLKRSDKLHDIRFESFNYLQKNGIPCNTRNYDLVYSGHMRPHETLENLFQKFNLESPEDFKGHSLSVSDVIVIREHDKSTAHYVDSIGFKELEHFEKSPAKTRESRDTRDFER